jgi:ribosomal protein L15E
MQMVNDSKSREIQELRQDNYQLESRSKVPRSDFSLEHIKSDMDIKNVIHSQEEARLIRQLEDTSHRMEDLHRQNIELQQELLRKDVEAKDASGKVRNREEEIEKLNELIDRL